MNLPQMMEKVAEAGYQGFEFGNWCAQDAAAITKLKNKLGLECACLVGNRAVNPKGMTLVDPADRVTFLAEIQASTEAARRFETTRLVTLTGNELPGVPREAQHKSIVEGLKRAHVVAARRHADRRAAQHARQSSGLLLEPLPRPSRSCARCRAPT
jgi:hydroxypyruvate isomerase